MKKNKNKKPFATKELIKKRYFSQSMADAYDAKHFSDFIGKHRHKRQVEIVDTLLKRIKPRFVVDVGAGTARLSFALKNTSRMIATDASEEMLTVARQRAGKNQECKQADVFNLPFKAGSVPCVLSTRLLWHFGENERKIFYQEVNRVLQKQGFFIFDAPNAKASKLFARKTFSRKPLETGTHKWTRKELIEELESNGFKVVTMKGLIFGQPLIRQLIKLSERYPQLAGQLFRMTEHGRVMRPAEWFVLCQKK